MAQPSYAPLVISPVSVVNPKFCSPGVVDLLLVRKVLSITDGNFAVTDVNGNLMFRVKGSLFSLRDKRVISDTTGNSIVTLRKKMFSAHKRWQVFRGDSSDTKDLIFSAKKSSLIQLTKTNLDVFLAANSKEEACDFKVKGSWYARSCTIHLGDTPTIIAQMHKRENLQSVLLGKDALAVTVYPNIDYVFVVTLILILQEMEEDADKNEKKKEKKEKKKRKEKTVVYEAGKDY